jgi:hypothetical protein
MSGAEVGLVVGLISGTITIVETVRKVYDTAKDQQGLPATFREVAERLPLVHSILNNAEAHAKGGHINDEASESILKQCKNKVEKLEKIFQEVISEESGSRLHRYYKAVRALGKDSKIESLMNGILDDLKLLSIQYGVDARDQVERLMEAIKAISALEPSVPDDVFEETNYTNNNLGSGTQNNFNASGGTNYNNTGPGNQFNAPITNAHFGKQ